LKRDAFGQPLYTAKCKTVSRISAMLISPLFNAAYTWSRSGSSVSAAATHGSVTKRRSRLLNVGRDHTSPNTKSIRPCSVAGVESSGAAKVITSANARLPRSERSAPTVVIATSPPRRP
jgi:hypothetical protein